VGTYNALGPEAPLSFAEFLYGCRAVTSANVSFTWVDTDFLLERELRPYRDFPGWMPARGNRAGFQRFDLTKPKSWRSGTQQGGKTAGFSTFLPH